MNALRRHRELERIWASRPGWRGKLTTVNNNDIGLMFLGLAVTFFVIAGILAMMIRAQLATPGSVFMGPEIYNQVFTMHGTIMMFLFAIPLFEGLTIYLLPKMLGTRDLAFPRLSAFGFWCYAFGGSLLIFSLIAGIAPKSGWFMYPPLSSTLGSPGINPDFWLLGITFVEISAISAAVEIIVTVLLYRAPGMSLDKLPIFAWYMLVVAVMILTGFPPLILGSILLELERAFGMPFFQVEAGGDSLLWQHLFWLFGHPEVYIIFLPAAGVISTILPVLARHPIIGYSWIVVSIIALGFLSFGLWVHHMFTVGIPHLAQAFFSAASMLVAIPTGVQVFSWLATLTSGRPQLKVPMFYLLGFFFVFVAGGLTGVMLAVVPFDWQAHDTHFVVAHLHYVLVGGFVFPMMAAAHYWLPHFTGRMPVYRLSVTAFWLIFVGFNATFLLMHLTGLRGMPRRVHTYAPDLGWDWLNLLSSIGGFVMTMGFALFVIDIALQLRFGRPAPRNPWQADTLEWAMPTPSPNYNFAALPDVASRSPVADDPDLAARLASGEGYLGFVRNGWRETLGIHMVTGKPDQIILLPGPTFLPLWSALATGVFFVSLLMKAYVLALIGAGLSVVLLVSWTRGAGLRKDHGPLPVGRGEAVPPHQEASGPPSWWATVFTLVANGTLFSSLLFGSLYLWLVAPGWPPARLLDIGPGLPLAGGFGLVLAALAGRRSLVEKAAAGITRASLWLIATAGGHILALACLVRLVQMVPDPTGHAYAATTAAILVYAGLHAALGILFAGYGWYRSLSGYVSVRRNLDLRIGRLWHDYTAVAGMVALIMVYGLPKVIGS